MFLPAQIQETIVDCALWADRLTRSDLIAGLIAGENDYTSNFTGGLRREINSRGVPGLNATSFVLNPVLERRIGADGCIVLANDHQFKICVFEAKWPRLSTHRNCWDSLQKSSGQSHFDEQLSRQRQASASFAKWEMFYCEWPFGKQPAYMPDWGSACVWHDDAYAASTTRRSKKVAWKDTELISLLTKSRFNVGQMIEDVCACKQGYPLAGKNFRAALDNFPYVQELLLIEFSDPKVERTQETPEEGPRDRRPRSFIKRSK